MKRLVDIPFADISGRTPVHLAWLYPERALALADAAKSTFGLVTRLVAAAGLPLADRVSRNWLERTDNPYCSEIGEIASLLGIRGTWFLNICFEWGCTTGVWNTDSGPVLRRVLDWPFPMLGENLAVARQTGEAGAFFNMTWPGFNGVLQAMAPGRFAAAINQAPMRRHGGGYLGDWMQNRIGVSRANSLPPAHLLRHVFENAPDFDAAKSMLSLSPIAVPAIFILSGAKAGEGCVIERTESACRVREMTAGRVCAANHFEAHPNDTARGWRARPIDSQGRRAAASELAADHQSFTWFRPPIANAHSRLAFNANAASGTLELMGVMGTEPVTNTFQLSRAA